MSFNSSQSSRSSDGGGGGGGGSRAGFSSFSLRDTYAFPFPGQHLVYYADGFQPEFYNRKFKSQAKNKKTNYFVKAFQWYTQEHGANRRTVNEKQEMGFPAWLDQKYEQYLWEVPLKHETLQSGVSSTVPSPTHSQGVVTRKSDKPKGFQKILRSPWRKRRAAAKLPEKRYDCSECRPSWQILLRPKSMSRLQSEICAQKVSLKLCASSRASVASSDTQITARTHSKRLDIVVQELLVRPNDTAYSNEDNRDKENYVMHDTSKTQHTDTDRSRINNWKKAVSEKRIKCECSVVPIEKIKSEKLNPHTLGDKKSLSVKNSKINVQCEYPAVPKEQTKSDAMVKSAHYDPNIFNSKEKPLSNTTITICGENTSRAKKSKTDITLCNCPVVTKDSAKNDKMVMDNGGQRNPNTIKTEEKSLGQTTTNPLIAQHQETQRALDRQPRVHGAAQTEPNEITFHALENAPGCGFPLFVRVMTTKQ